MSNAFAKLAACIVFRKQAGEHSKIWKTVGKNAPLYALAGGLAGTALRNPENVTAIVDAPGAALNALLSPITKHLPDSVLEYNPLKDSVRKALSKANVEDMDELYKQVLKDHPNTSSFSTGSVGDGALDALGFPQSMKSGGGNVLDFIPFNRVDESGNAFTGEGLPINRQNMLNALSQIPGDFGRGALLGTAALGGIGAGLSSGTEISKAILRRKHPFAMALNEKVVRPLRELRSRD